MTYGQLLGQEARQEGITIGILQGIKEGRLQGKIEDRLEGKIEGRLEAKIEVARLMLQEQEPVEKIVKLTGLTKEEIHRVTV